MAENARTLETPVTENERAFIAWTRTLNKAQMNVLEAFLAARAKSCFDGAGDALTFYERMGAAALEMDGVR